MGCGFPKTVSEVDVIHGHALGVQALGVFGWTHQPCGVIKAHAFRRTEKLIGDILAHDEA